MSKMNPRVDAQLQKAPAWQKETSQLRKICLDCGLTEDLKWRLPCYSLNNNNIVIIQWFKEYCALMFFKGALLKDPKRILSKIGQRTQSARQLRFTNVRQIVELAPVVKAYIREAMEVEKAGLKVPLKKTSDFEVPAELQAKLDESPAFKTAFESLTPGRQRGYLVYFAAAKQSTTRAARVEKYQRRILKGKGLND